MSGGAKRESSPTIVEFREKNAQQLAELFNSFDEEGLWPGGFTGGVPYTAERILNSFPVAVKNICVLVSTFNGKYTGICTLHPHSEDAEAAYIGLLGVHPNYLGKGHGKELILESLQVAVNNGLRRVDLDTWAGNMRAVPLYKKCGMFWLPETSVRMQDYVPGILRFPIAEEFFKKHDWYSSQRRKLELTPDEFKLGKMEVFPYEFSKDEDYLKVLVDRYGRCITGLERTLDGEHLKISVKLADHKVIAGLEQNLTIEIENKTKDHMQGSVLVSGFKGLTFTSRPKQSFNVATNASVKLDATFTVNKEIEVLDISRKQRTIKTNLILNGQLIPFETGMRILPLLTFSTNPESITVAPGTKGKTQFNVFNNSKERFAGEVFIVDELKQLSLKDNTFPIEVPSESHSGFNVEIEVSDSQPTSLIPLKAFARGKVKGVDVEAKTKIVHVKCLRPSGIVSWTERTEQGETVFVESEDLLAGVELRRGFLEITFKNTLQGARKIWRYGRFEVGPPFGFVKPANYDYKLLPGQETLKLVLSGIHPDRPGVKMVRILTFYRGSSLVKEKAGIVNLNSNVLHKLKVRIHGRGLFGNPSYKMIVPLEEILEHEMVGFPVSESDLPTNPRDFKESWICFQDQSLDFCFGQIWSNEKLGKIRIGEQSHFNPEYELGKVEPGQSAWASELYYVMERGNWQTIQKKWQLLIEKKVLKEEKTVRPQPLFNVKLTNIKLYDRNMMKTRLQAANFRNKGVTGRIALTPPRGWIINPLRFDVKDVTKENPFESEVSIVPPHEAEVGVYRGKIRFSSEEQEMQFPLDLGILSKDTNHPVKVVSEQEKKKRVFKVSNGFLQFKASAEFAATLYSLERDGVSQLATSFPNICTKVFLENYSGGIRALYLDEDFDFQKSKTHMESFEAEKVEEGDLKGVKFSFESKQQKEIRGIIGSISYLTLPFSNLVLIRRRFKNTTLASSRFNSCIWISPNVGGSFDRNEVVFPRSNQIFQFKRGTSFAFSGVQPEKGWAFIVNPKEKIGLGIITGNVDKSTILSLDLGKTMLELLVTSRIQLQPGQNTELEDYVVL